MTTAVPELRPDTAEIVDSPSPVARTSPDALTVATIGSLLVHASVPVTTLPSASAVSRTVSPRAASATLSGLIDRTTGARTSNPALPVTPDAVAMISTDPGPLPVTSPVASTVATAESLDTQEKPLSSATRCPLASAASAAKRTVSPTKTVSAAGETVTVPTAWRTVTSAVALSCWKEALTVAAPLPAEVARPPAFTVTMSVSLLVQVTVPLNTAPFWSVSIAVKVTVSPMAEKAAEVGEIEMATALGGSTTVVSSPQAATSAKTAMAAGARK